MSRPQVRNAAEFVSAYARLIVPVNGNELVLHANNPRRPSRFTGFVNYLRRVSAGLDRNVPYRALQYAAKRHDYHVESMPISLLSDRAMNRLSRQPMYQQAIETVLLSTLPYGSERVNYNRLFTDFEYIGSGANGDAYAASLSSSGKRDVIIKISKSSKGPPPSLVREAAIGISAINHVNYLAPNFVWTYGASHCADVSCNKLSRDYLMIMTERAKGVPLYRLIRRLTERELVEVVTQVFFAMQVANDRYEFTHYDLHAGNILVEQTNRPQLLRYIFDDRIVTIRTSFVARIIDYGMGHAKVHTRNGLERVGVTRFEKEGIGAISNPFYDVARLMTDIACTSKNRWAQIAASHLINDYDCETPFTIPVYFRELNYLNFLAFILRFTQYLPSLSFAPITPEQVELYLESNCAALPGRPRLCSMSLRRILDQIVVQPSTLPLIIPPNKLDLFFPAKPNLLANLGLSHSELVNLLYYITMARALPTNSYVRAQLASFTVDRRALCTAMRSVLDTENGLSKELAQNAIDWACQAN